MKKSELRKLTVTELKKMASKKGLKIPSKAVKDDIISLVSRSLDKVIKGEAPPRKKKSDLQAKSSAKKRNSHSSLRSKKKPSKAPRSEEKAVKAEKPIEVGGYGFEVKPGVPSEEENFNFPYGYQRDLINLMARDPEWIFTYWTISSDTVGRIQKQFPNLDFQSMRLVLRMFEVHSPSDRRLVQEHYPQYGTSSYYLNAARKDCHYQCEIGFLTHDDRYLFLCASNRVQMPSDHFSGHVDENWINGDNAKRIFNGNGKPSRTVYSLEPICRECPISVPAVIQKSLSNRHQTPAPRPN